MSCRLYTPRPRPNFLKRPLPSCVPPWHTIIYAFGQCWIQVTSSPADQYNTTLLTLCREICFLVHAFQPVNSMLTAQFQAKSFIWCYQKRGCSEQNHEVINGAVQSKMLCLESSTEWFNAKCFVWCYQQSSLMEQNTLFGVINGAVRSNISEVINKAVRSKMFCVELSREQSEATYLKASTRHLKQNVSFGVLMFSSMGWTKSVLTGCSPLGTEFVSNEA